MKRKKFIQTCGFACIGFTAGSILIQGCSSTSAISGTIVGSDLVVRLSDFKIETNSGTSFKTHVVVEHDQLQFPLYLYRHNQNEYSAVLMRCTHQGTELQSYGEKLQCPAHGSEFDNRGNVQNGPASDRLRSFPVTIADNQLKISLK